MGFTLVEMMVGLTLLGVFMSGIFGSVQLSSVVSESAIYDNTAATISQGYLEQIKSLPYEDILLAAQNPADISLKTISPYYSSSQNSIVYEEPISINPSSQPNERDIRIDVRNGGSGSIVIMPMKFWVTVDDLNTGSKPVSALQIKIVYAFKLPNIMGGNWIERQVQAIRSRM